MTEQRKLFLRGDEICYISREDDQSFGMPIPVARFFGDESDKVELEACLAAQPSPQRVAVPEGWKLVPKEPTRGMLDSAHVNFRKDIEIDPLLKTSYRAMLAAAPQPDGVGDALAGACLSPCIKTP
ncbi:hypothetical protein EAY64_06395 [Aquitalea palustris]|uniref:Uncharacterized protein n=1 Tax=Aquitalea palustris TaxID=2480983 RepID=A0A454JKT3_9NEIS|nr:hypothetical protein [Aquitalea palustris]RMC99931.1 hypothetical protein EAY64_06395 [Aquitalea palustris]